MKRTQEQVDRERRSAQEAAVRRILTPASVDDIDNAKALLRRMAVSSDFATGIDIEQIAFRYNEGSESAAIADIRHEFLRLWLEERTKARTVRTRGRKR